MASRRRDREREKERESERGERAAILAQVFPCAPPCAGVAGHRTVSPLGAFFGGERVDAWAGSGGLRPHDRGYL